MTHNFFYKREKLKNLSLFLAGFFLLPLSTAFATETGYDCLSPENRDKPIRIEVTLSKKWKKKKREVIATFQKGEGDASIRVKFFPFLEPPMNIGIGRCITSGEARRAFQNAIKFNRGVEHVILQNIVPHHWIGIGTTHLAELSWNLLQPGELERLMDPDLNTAEFHKLYNEIARMVERQLPFGLDPIPYTKPENGPRAPLPEPP